MPERVTRVTLKAVTAEYIEGMRRAADETERTGTAAEKLAQQRQALESLGRTGLVVGGALAAGVGVAIARAAEFEQAMSQVNAVTQETASNQNLLRDAALEAGGATIYTAREAAQAEEELAKAGLNTAQILGGALTGSLDLAASGQLEVARAAEITGITLKQFGLDGTQASRVADVLSAGANKAVGSVDDLANALKFAGPVAASLGASLEDTTATLAFFADQGIVGEQAGSALRGMLASLQAPSAQAQKTLDALGVTIYDGTGKFIGMRGVVEQLETSLKNKTQAERDAALGIIFTNAQLTTAQVLVGQGADKWQEYRDAVDESGIAARIAAERMDNLAGDVEKLGGAFDTVLIRSGSDANEVLRGLVQSATFLVDMVGELPQPVLNAGIAVGGLGAVVLVTGGLAMMAVPKWAAYKQSLEDLRWSANGVRVAVAGASGAIGLATIIVGAWIEKQAKIAAVGDAVKDSLDQATGAFTDYSREVVAKGFADSGAAKTAEQLGISLDLLTDAAFGSADALAEVNAKIDERAGGGSGTGAAAFRDLRNELNGVRTEIENAPEEWKAVKDATDEAAGAAKRNEAALAGLRGEAGETADAVEGLADQIRNFGQSTLDVRDANRQFEAAFDDLTESIQANGASLDDSTEQGRANNAAIDDLVESTLELAAAKYEQTGSEDEATAAILRGRDALIEQLAKLGITGAEAEAYADSLGLIPGNIATVIDLDTTAATRELNEWLRNAGGNVTAAVSGMRYAAMAAAQANAQGRENGGVEVHAFANGGMPGGFYTGGPIYKFAEQGLPWEAFISPKPGRERENFGYALESMMRLSQQMGYSFGAAPQSSVDQSVTNNFKVDAADPVLAAEFIGQRIGGILAVRR